MRGERGKRDGQICVVVFLKVKGLKRKKKTQKKTKVKGWLGVDSAEGEEVGWGHKIWGQNIKKIF